jgi:hypothetical protein
MPNLLGRLLGSGGSTETAPDAPTIAYSSRTTTAIVIAHTPPADTTDYTQTRIYYGVEGAAASGSQTSSAAENVAFSGLTAGARYWFIAVSESSTPLNSTPAAPVFAHTLFSSASSNGASAIKAAIKTLMASVTGLDAATIHTRTRRPHDMTPADLASLYVSGSAINGWEIEEENFGALWGMANNGWEMRDSFVIRGIYAWDDTANSEATFRTILQGIVEALNADISLVGTCRRHEAVQLREYAHRQITNETVHYAELSLVCNWTETT